MVQPVISVDTKKEGSWGDFQKRGPEKLRSRETRNRWRVHDFGLPELDRSTHFRMASYERGQEISKGLGEQWGSMYLRHTRQLRRGEGMPARVVALFGMRGKPVRVSAEACSAFADLPPTRGVASGLTGKALCWKLSCRSWHMTTGLHISVFIYLRAPAKVEQDRATDCFFLHHPRTWGVW